MRRLGACALALFALATFAFVAYVWANAPEPHGAGDTPTLPSSSSTP